MKLTPIAFESLGVRSQATFVETSDLNILIDPAASLAPRRYGLPPHSLEVEALEERASLIREKGNEADVLIITHYHYDHHDPGYVTPLKIYQKKKVILKDPEHNINPSQRFKRAPKFIKRVREVASSIEIGDGREFRIGNTVIRVLHPIPHGPDTRLGYVIPVLIQDREESVLFTSDTEGVPGEAHIGELTSVTASVIVIDGPLSYLVGRAWSEEELHRSVKNIELLLKEGLHTMIVDHHIMRDIEYDRILEPLRDIAKSLGIRVLDASSYLGVERRNLEARRRELFKEKNTPGELSKGMRELLGEE